MAERKMEWGGGQVRDLAGGKQKRVSETSWHSTFTCAIWAGTV